MKSLAIAGNTIREARRHKIFYSIFFFALIIILNSFLFTHLTIATYDRILRDVGTTAIDFFGVLLAIFLGVGMVSREVDRRTVYTVVTKPIRRADFIIGKYLGLSGVLLVTLGLMFVCFLGVVAMISQEQVNLGTLLWYFGLRLVELSILVSFAILMSTFTTSALSAFFTVGFFIIGRLSSDLHFFGSRSDSAVVRVISEGLYYALPNLERFNVSRQITYNEVVDAGTSLLSVGYGLLYTAAFLIFAMVVFERRDFR
jgi:ABC-type transport system involved in multi-copper enzyme maturation permease subunit